MRLTISDPAAIPELLTALRRGQCLAIRGRESSVDVVFPWVTTLWEARQAIIEIEFFARAWEATHPGLTIQVDARG